ncbi:hypothetical protein [Bacteroides hominis]|uniref:hypothetical protein n=1 Tax=Bacteroides hominis TaxID=2763023 RepID=UPI002949D2DC|nr:hypothetical protein [Bacteroides hominis (ex Liu et al. 2022)]MDV6193353.1 hypothetical protein [Bacteroides hominis (ex Liu et al. 2022)]
MTAQLFGGNPVLPQNGILVFPPVGGCRGVPVFLYEAPCPSMRSTLVRVCEALALIIFI